MTASAPEEHVILVDEADCEVGIEERMRAHQQGLLHRAVSVFVFNDSGELLLQRRAPSKAAFAGKWANSCCTHARRDESVVETGERRLREEMGLRVSLSYVGSFVYEALDPQSGLTEHEFDHVLVGVTDEELDPDPDEVDGFEWADLDVLRRLADDSERYAPWLGEALRAFPELGPLGQRDPSDHQRHGGAGDQ